MQDLIRTLQSGIERLTEEPVTKRSNPIPFADFIDAARKAYGKIFAAIQTLITQNAIDPTDAANSANFSDELLERIAPVSETDAYELQQVSLEILINHRRKIAIPITTSEDRKDRATDSIFLLYMSCALYAYMLKTQQVRLQLEQARAIDYPYLIKNGLVRSQEPILSYCMSDLLAALYQLTARAKDIPYDSAFVEYLELLTIRAAQFLNLTFNGWKHDVVAVRAVLISSTASTIGGDDALPEASFDESETEWEYQCNREASTLLQCTICALYEKLSFVGIVPQSDIVTLLIHETTSKHIGRVLLEYYGINIKTSEWHDVVVLGFEEQWPLMETQADNRLEAIFQRQTNGVIPYEAVSRESQSIFKNWILYNLDIMDGSSGSKKLRENYMKLCIRPGDREKFLKEFPDLTCTDQNILSTYRATEYDKLREQADRTIEDVLEKEIDKRPEPLSFLLVLCDFLGTFFSENFYPLSWDNYVIFEDELNARITDLDAMPNSVPVIVQVFNHFQLYYVGKLYRFDSFVCAILAWLHILQGPSFNRQIKRVSVQGWYDELNAVRTGKKKPSIQRTNKMQREHDQTVRDPKELEAEFALPEEQDEEVAEATTTDEPLAKKTVSYAANDTIIVNGIL